MFRDAKADHSFAVAAKVQTVLLGAAHHCGDIGQAHKVTARAAMDHQLAEVFRLDKHSVHAQGKLLVFGFDAARRQLNVLRAKRTFDVRDREVVGGEFYPVHPDAHRVTLAAANAHAGNPVDHRKTVHQVPLCVIGQRRYV